MYDYYAPLAGCIEYFTVDRAKLYDTVVKSIQVFLTNGDVEIHNIAIERLNCNHLLLILPAEKALPLQPIKKW